MSELRPIIQIKNLWKSFSFGKRGPDTLKARVLSLFKSSFSPQAVRKELYSGLTLSIYPGEVVAFLGKNGSGKSTLLKLISRIYWPDKGEIEVKGKLSALIELGAGFHPEFSGRENVIVYGQVLGISKQQILGLMDQIIEFSELGEYIDQPVKVYSSGMYMRLAFSVAVMVDPDVLIIDEILSVGDFSFAKKCMAKMNEFKKNGKTICLVSHDLQTIQAWATRAIVLSGGRVVFDGTPSAAVRVYLGLEESKSSSIVSGTGTVLGTSLPANETKIELWQDRFLTTFMRPVNIVFDEDLKNPCWVVVVSSARDILPFGYSFPKFKAICGKFFEERSKTPHLQLKICVIRSSDGSELVKSVFSKLSREPSAAANLEIFSFESHGLDSCRVPIQSTFFSLDWVATSQLHSVFQYRTHGIDLNQLRHVAQWGRHDLYELPRDEHSARLESRNSRVPIDWQTGSCRMPANVRVSGSETVMGEPECPFKVFVFSDFFLTSSKVNFARRAIQEFLLRLPSTDRSQIQIVYWGDPVDPAALTPESSQVSRSWPEVVLFDTQKSIFLFVHSHDLFAEAEEKLRQNSCCVVGGNNLELFPSESSLADELVAVFESIKNHHDLSGLLTLQFQDGTLDDAN